MKTFLSDLSNSFSKFTAQSFLSFLSFMVTLFVYIQLFSQYIYVSFISSYVNKIDAYFSLRFGSAYALFLYKFKVWTPFIFKEFYSIIIDGGHPTTIVRFVAHYILVLSAFLSVSFFIIPLSNESLLWLTAACAFYYACMYAGPSISSSLTIEIDQIKTLMEKRSRLIKDVSHLQSLLFSTQSSYLTVLEDMLSLSSQVVNSDNFVSDHIFSIFNELVEEQVRVLNGLKASDELLKNLVDFESETNELLIEFLEKNT